MKRGIFLIGSAALLSLGACSKGDDKQASGANQSVAEVAEEMAEVKIQPGQWQATQETTDVKLENAPEGMPAGMMDSMKGRKRTVTYCITPEQARQDNMFSGKVEGNCTLTDVVKTGDTVTGTLRCTGPDATGNFKARIASPEHFTTRVSMRSSRGDLDVETEGRWLAAQCGN